MRIRATLDTTTRNMAALGWATLIAAGMVMVYGLINAWATVTSTSPSAASDAPYSRG